VNWAWALVAPLVAQIVAMGFDELRYHRRRGLGAWERMGHPLDTLSVLACMGWALSTRPTPRSVAGYVALALVSCVLVTKDEFVHARRCSPGEHWVHALLFVLHPLSLGSIGLLWPAIQSQPAALPDWLRGTASLAPVVAVQFVLTAAFFIYQIAYWNLPWFRRVSPAR
jgi:hypothetical protein